MEDSELFTPCWMDRKEDKAHGMATTLEWYLYPILNGKQRITLKDNAKYSGYDMLPI